jgi:DNA repair ATPase RecN
MPCFDGGGNENDYRTDYGNEVREQQRKLHDLDDKHHKAVNKIQAQENELCDLRNMLVQILEGKEVPKEKLNKLKKKVRDTQLIHRKEEREFRVAFIKKELAKLKKTARDIEGLGGEVKTSMKNTIKKMEEEITRIMLLTDEQLLDKEGYPF